VPRPRAHHTRVYVLPKRSNSCSCRTRNILDCNSSGNIADLIQEQVPPWRLEAARSLAYGAGESTFRVREFASRRAAECCTVPLHEADRCGCSGREIALRDEFFPVRFTFDENS